MNWNSLRPTWPYSVAVERVARNISRNPFRGTPTGRYQWVAPMCVSRIPTLLIRFERPCGERDAQGGLAGSLGGYR
jgi:hypothetical protein